MSYWELLVFKYLVHTLVIILTDSSVPQLREILKGKVILRGSAYRAPPHPQPLLQIIFCCFEELCLNVFRNTGLICVAVGFGWVFFFIWLIGLFVYHMRL